MFDDDDFGGKMFKNKKNDFFGGGFPSMGMMGGFGDFDMDGFSGGGGGGFSKSVQTSTIIKYIFAIN
jgi:hypothetical protein